MNTLKIRNIGFAILMALALTFSVQGTADALTFGTTRTGDFETALPNDEFTIKFSVSLKSNASIYEPGSTTKLVTQESTPRYINSEGYLVAYIGGKTYRNAKTPSGTLKIEPLQNYSSDAGTPQTPYTTSSGYTVDANGKAVYVQTGGGTVSNPWTYTRATGATPSGTLKIKPLRKYSSDAGTPNSPYYVDASKNVVDANGKAVYVQTGTGGFSDSSDDPWKYTRATGELQDKVDPSLRYHFNEEQVTITAEGAQIKKVGTHDIFGTHSTWTLEETGKDGKKLSSSTTTLTLTAPGPAEVVITIADTTPRDDLPLDYRKDSGTGSKYTSNSTYTVYVVNFDETVRKSTDIDFSITDGTEVDSTTEAVDRSSQYPQPIGFELTGTPNTHIPLVFKVEGGGQVYVREDDIDKRATDRDQKGRSSTTLNTSSEAKVWLDMRGNTNKVTVYPRGKNPSTHGKSIIYIHGYAQLTVTEGSGQTGAPGGRLEEVLGVKVTDSKNRAIRYPLIVRFPATGDNDNNGTNGGRFIPLPGTTLLVANQKQEADSVSPTAAAVHEVYTDSSGIAKIYYQLASAGLTMGTSYPITPGLKHNTGVTDTFRFNTGTTGSNRVANLEILSGNPQSAEKAKNLKDPLVVIARSTAGYRIPNVVIQFRTSIGTLSRHGLTKEPLENGRSDPNADPNPDTLQWGEIPANTPNPNTGQQIYVRTGSDGQASVDYNIGQFVIARTVTAEIRHEPLDSNYSFAIDQVTFNINGTGSTTTPPATTQPTTPTTQPTTPTTPRLSISVTGEGTTRTVTVNASDGRRVLATLGGTALAASPTTPSTPGTTGTVYQVGDSIPRAAGILAGGATFNISGSLRLNDRVYTCINPPCQIRDYVVTQGTLSTGATAPSSTVTATTGTPRTITVPSTPGSYTLTATATGYTSASTTVTVAAGTTGTLSISVPFSGAPGSTQNATVTATGSDGTAASGVAVTLAVTNGGGTFSPASVTTGTAGTAVSVLTRGNTVGTNYFVTATATGYTEARSRISITDGSTPPTTTTPTTPTTGTTPTTPASGTPSLISITGESTRSGTVNEELASPLAVEVLDSKGGPADARVVFRVRSGQGRLSQRGNGRAVAVETDARGNARADYIPKSASSTVEARVAGVSETVTFTITTGAAPATGTPGTGTSTRPIDPKVLVAAANRPAMVWIDNGMLYGLTGATAEKIADGANGVAVGGGKVYWTAGTGNSGGQRA